MDPVPKRCDFSPRTPAMRFQFRFLVKLCWNKRASQNRPQPVAPKCLRGQLIVQAQKVSTLPVKSFEQINHLNLKHVSAPKRLAGKSQLQNEGSPGQMITELAWRQNEPMYDAGPLFWRLFLLSGIGRILNCPHILKDPPDMDQHPTSLWASAAVETAETRLRFAHAESVRLVQARSFFSGLTFGKPRGCSFFILVPSLRPSVAQGAPFVGAPYVSLFHITPPKGSTLDVGNRKVMLETTKRGDIGNPVCSGFHRGIATLHFEPRSSAAKSKIGKRPRKDGSKPFGRVPYIYPTSPFAANLKFLAGC